MKEKIMKTMEELEEAGDLIAYRINRIDNELVCCECVTDEEMDALVSIPYNDDVIWDSQRNDTKIFCVGCKKEI